MTPHILARVAGSLYLSKHGFPTARRLSAMRFDSYDLAEQHRTTELDEEWQSLYAPQPLVLDPETEMDL